MKTNIFFLDLDGPAFPDMTIRFDPMNRKDYPGSGKYHGKLSYWKMNEHFRYFWQHINDVFDFKVVLSSAWKKQIDEREFYEEMFAVNNLPINFHEDWRTTNWRPRGMSDYTCYRAQEIFDWVDRHKEVDNRYVIMDDIQSGQSLNIVKNREDASNFEHYQLERLKHVTLDPAAIILVDYDSGIGSHEALRVIERMKTW
jgi:hypothetical protein